MNTTQTVPQSFLNLSVSLPDRLRAAGGRLDQVVVIHWLLRLACVGEYIGHGAFGIITKAGWLPYFAVVGIPADIAWRLMPIVGTIDVLAGIVVFIKPIRAVLLYMAIWGLWTALLRPLSGEPIWEMFERFPNYGVPFALLYLRGFARTWREWLQ